MVLATSNVLSDDSGLAHVRCEGSSPRQYLVQGLMFCAMF